MGRKLDKLKRAGSKIKGGAKRVGGALKKGHSKVSNWAKRHRARKSTRRTYRTPRAAESLRKRTSGKSRAQRKLDRLNEKLQNRKTKLQIKKARREYYGHLFKSIMIFLFILVIIPFFLGGSALYFTGNTGMLNKVPVVGSLVVDFWENLGGQAGMETKAKETKKGLRGWLPTDFWKGVDILRGKQEPSTLWKSKKIHDKYVEKGAGKAGIEISNLRPLRSQFYLNSSGETKASIAANLRVNTFPGTNTKLNISAKNGGDWKCDKESLTIKQAYGRTLTCSKTITKDQSVTFRAEYSHLTKAGMNLYMVEGEELYNVYAQDKDPLDYYNIKKEQTKSWVVPSEPVNLGLGTSRDLLPVYNGSNKYILGVTVENVGLGTLKEINTVYLIASKELKNTPESDFRKITSSGMNEYLDQLRKAMGEAFVDRFKKSLQSNYGLDINNLEDSNASLYVLNVSQQSLKSNLGKNKGQTFNFVFRVSSSRLKSKTLEEYTLEATSVCDYLYKEYTTVRVKDIGLNESSE